MNKELIRYERKGCQASKREGFQGECRNKLKKLYDGNFVVLKSDANEYLRFEVCVGSAC